MSTKADWFFNKPSKWQAAYTILRKIALECGLTEELKWGCPCYTLDKSNVVLIHGFKDYCAFLFHKGALLKDKKSILIQQTENVQAARQIRFTTTEDIKKMERILKAYIKEAIAVEKAGLKVVMKKISDFKIPEEFENALKEMPELKTAFKALTPGRQKSYIFHFAAAKQSITREARIKKFIPKILDGKGMED